MWASRLLAVFAAALPFVLASAGTDNDHNDFVRRATPLYGSSAASMYSTGFNIFSRQSGNCSLSQV